MKHWEYTQYVNKEEYCLFKDKGTGIKPDVQIPYNTAVYIDCVEQGKRLEGVYDPITKCIRPLKVRNAPNRDMRLYMDALLSEHLTVILVDGLMGTGKTSACVQHLCKSLPKDLPRSEADGAIIPRKPSQKKIMIAKPYVTAEDEDYGFLPGDINDKIEPTIQNFTQYFNRYHKEGFHNLQSGDYVSVLPLGFIRGLDATNMTVVVDEAQNTKELISVVTRRANDSRIIILGDTSPFQIDAKGNTPEHNGMSHLADLLEGASYFQHIELKTVEHVLRSSEVADIVRRLFKKYGGNIANWSE